jgi:hypothetical protein
VKLVQSHKVAAVQDGFKAHSLDTSLKSTLQIDIIDVEIVSELLSDDVHITLRSSRSFPSLATRTLPRTLICPRTFQRVLNWVSWRLPSLAWYYNSALLVQDNWSWLSIKGAGVKGSSRVKSLECVRKWTLNDSFSDEPALGQRRTSSLLYYFTQHQACWCIGQLDKGLEAGIFGWPHWLNHKDFD